MRQGKETETHAIVPAGAETPVRIEGLTTKPGKVEIDPDHLVLLADRRVKKTKKK